MKLKPCPFCGGDAHITFRGTQNDEKWRGYIVCRCKQCGAQERGCFYWGKSIEIELEETVGGLDCAERWQHRV